MLSQWILYLFLPLWLPLSFRSLVFAGEKLKESRQPGTGTVVQQLSRSSQKFNKGGLTPGNTLIVPENADSPGAPLSWPLTSFEESDRQGVFGEYTDTQESLETLDLGDNEEGLTIQTDSANEDATSEAGPQRQEPSSEGATPPPSYQQTSNYESEEDSSLANGSLLRPTFPARQNATLNKHLPLFLPGPLPSDVPSQSESPPYSGTVPTSKHSPLPVATGRMGSTAGLSVTTQGKVEKQTIAGVGNAHVTGDVSENEADRKAENDDPKGDDQELSMNQRESLPSGYEDTSATPCRTSNHTWPPVYLDDFTPNESLRPSLALSPPLFVPLYSDWNSALAAWGFAWEAHIYGVGSIFSVFGLISVVCLLGLPLRCPAGSPYLTLLHLFLLAFAGIQAFCLLYDAYSHQDRLPPLIALLLSQLPFPCLTSAFSLAFLILSLRSRRRLSLPLALSSSFSALPKPCLLLCMCLLHFGVALGCVGILQLFHSLPAMILLLPQSMFVCLAIFLSFSYLISYCLIRVNTKHIYRLNDNCESGGSPEARQSASCPFAKVEDWGRAAGAGVWASLCLLGCGGLQLYGVLHSLGFGGVEGYGFLPWPWWGYQIGCRLCEAGVCLGLSLIGTHPLFCHHSSIKTISHPRPGSWSRLSCSSPSRGLTLPSQGGVSPILSTHDSWSQSKQDKMVVCDIITKRRSEALPLSSVADPPGNGLDCAPKFSRTWTTMPPLPTPPSPPHKLKNPPESQLSSLNSLDLEADSTVDLRPPSPIDLSRSIDQALYSESLFSHSIFGLPRLFHASSSHSLSSPNQGAQKSGPSTTENSLYRTSSCGDMDQENNMLSTSRPSQPQGSLKSHNTGVTSPEPSDWKGSTSGSTMGLCSKPKETGKLRSHSWANRGQNFAQSSLPRAIPHLSYHRRYRTLSLASQDSQGSGRLAGTKNLSESKQLEWDMAVQAEFVNVCRQIDALSVCSDTIEL